MAFLRLKTDNPGYRVRHLDNPSNAIKESREELIRWSWKQWTKWIAVFPKQVSNLTTVDIAFDPNSTSKTSYIGNPITQAAVTIGPLEYNSSESTLKYALVHELGHVLGLPANHFHARWTKAVMSKNRSGISEPQAPDVIQLWKRYPPSEFATKTVMFKDVPQPE